MAKSVVVRKSGKQGKGLFALRDFKKGEVVIHNDYTKLKRYTLKQIEESGIDADHWGYAGYNTYALDFSPESYVNHSCNPNTYVEFKVIGKIDLIAIKPIKKGEEITKDYSLGAIERIAGKNPDYPLECRCGSKNCRKKVTMDFFKLPKRIQREKLPYLSTWVKRKFRNRLKGLKKHF